MKKKVLIPVLFISVLAMQPGWQIIVELPKENRPTLLGTAVSPDKKYLVTGFSTGFDRTNCAILNLINGEYLFIKKIHDSEKLEIKREALGMTFFPKPVFYPLPDNSGFAHYTGSHTFIVLRNWSGQLVKKFKLKHEIRHLLFHPSMKWFVVELYDKVLFYSPEGKKIAQFNPGLRFISSLDISPDRKRLLIQTHGNMTSDTRRLILLLDITDLQQIKVIWEKDVSHKEYLGGNKIKFQMSDGARFNHRGDRIIYGYTRPDRMGIYFISAKDASPLADVTVSTHAVNFAFNRDDSGFYAAHSEKSSASRGNITPVTSWSFYRGDIILNNIYNIMPDFGAGRIDLLTNENIFAVSRPSGGTSEIIFYNTRTDSTCELLIFNDGRWIAKDNRGNYDVSDGKPLPLKRSGHTTRVKGLIPSFVQGK